MPNLSTPIRLEKREPKAEGRTPNKKKKQEQQDEISSWSKNASLAYLLDRYRNCMAYVY